MNIKTLYQFFPINKNTISNLVNRKIWISDPSKFNDPFEFCKRPSYTLVESGIQYLKPEENKLLDYIHEQTENLGVVCYTECGIDSSLMWSIYAENHHGICLVFEIDLDKTHIHKVNYQNILPELDLTEDPETTHKNILKIATTKAESWAHEKEWRQVFAQKKNHYEYPTLPKSIYFGCRCPIEDIRIIWNLLIPLYGKELEFWKASLQEGTFNLTFACQPKEHNDLDKFPIFWD